MRQATYFPFETFFVDYVKNTEKNDMKAQHYHDAYEIYLQIAGERYLFLDDICYTLKRGDLVILNPFDIHYTESSDAKYYERYVVNFHAESLSFLLNDNERRILFASFSSCVIHLTEKQTAAVYEQFKCIDVLSEKTGFLSEKLLYSAIFQMLMTLRDFIEKANPVLTQNIQPEIVTALHYIHEHYHENIDLDILSEIVHMSKYHFCRLFHRATGATFLEHLYNIRLSKVHQLLLETNMTLAEIAYKTGFSSTAHLSRIFHQMYHISPRDFRKAAKQSPSS